MLAGPVLKALSFTSLAVIPGQHQPSREGEGGVLGEQCRQGAKGNAEEGCSLENMGLPTSQPGDLANEKGVKCSPELDGA